MAQIPLMMSKCTSQSSRNCLIQILVDRNTYGLLRRFESSPCTVLVLRLLHLRGNDSRVDSPPRSHLPGPLTTDTFLQGTIRSLSDIRAPYSDSPRNVFLGRTLGSRQGCPAHYGSHIALVGRTHIQRRQKTSDHRSH